MDFINFFQNKEIVVGSWQTTLLMLILTVIVLVTIIVAYKKFKPKALAYLFSKNNPPEDEQKLISKRLDALLIYLVLIIGMGMLNFDVTLYHWDKFDLTLKLIFELLALFQFARLMDYIISNVWMAGYEQLYYVPDEDSNIQKPIVYDENKKSQKTVLRIMYCVVALFLINKLQLDFTFFSIPLGQDNADIPFRLSNIIFAVLIILLAQLIANFITQIILYTYYKNRKIDVGSQYAINRLIVYVIYIIAIFAALQVMGFKFTVLIGGLAALLVGVGLGLQHVFNDLMSGILMLFERNIEVGDIIQLQDGRVGTVRKIGLRTSLLESRGNIIMIIPNSTFTTDTINNWSHYDDKVRFEVKVGVSYDSDLDLVKKILLEQASQNPHVLKFPAPIVRIVDFGNSSIDFELLFWSRNLIFIEDTKSELRSEIAQSFRSHEVQIPFPQMDVWMKNNGNKPSPQA